ncbi:uncharacterized protein LOC142350365 isoform X2 [Convolutriloba macropyga]|uniref:uncharacterized protein LOC142350365 isoform X2 n=1 Tax=Convolutriloba macropyga TaxID=536237 RepID=UPI003F524F5B
MSQTVKPINIEAKGNIVDLGDLYDHKNREFFGGLSLWESTSLQKIKPIPCQDLHFSFSKNLDDLKKHIGWDGEFVLGGGTPKSGIPVAGPIPIPAAVAGLPVQAKGSFRFLGDKINKADENTAVLIVTCKIPMETMMSTPVKFRNLITKFSNISHFVCEVTEGGMTNITFKKKCNSKEDANKFTGALQASLTLISQDSPLGSITKYLKTFRDLDKSGISGENHNNQKSDEKLKPVENNQASTTATGNKNEKEEDKNIDQSTEKSKVDSDPNKETNREPDKLTMPKDTDDANVIIGGKLHRNKQKTETHVNLTVEASGVIEKCISTEEEALETIRELPALLSRQQITLSLKLLPISMVLHN